MITKTTNKLSAAIIGLNLIVGGGFLSPNISLAQSYDTGWMDVSQDNIISTQGNKVQTCGFTDIYIGAQYGNLFANIPLPAGKYSVDIKAVYGQKEGRPQQANETITAQSGSDSKNVPDLGNDWTNDVCAHDNQLIRVYPNITGTPLLFNEGGKLTLIGTGDSIHIMAIRIYGEQTPQEKNDALCVGISAPNQVNTGENFTATVSMKNNGTTTWLKNQLYRLGSQNPADNNRWGTARILLPSDSVGPNETAIFNFSAKAPATAGSYAFDWKMLKENIEWFGTTCSKSIQVNSPVPDPAADIKANGSDGPITISYDSSATISWTSTNADSCYITPGSWTGTSGSKNSGNLTTTKTYTVNCSKGAKTASDSVEVKVSNPPLPTTDIKANGSDGPITISYNSSAVISWTSTSANYCYVMPGSWTGTNGSKNSGNLTAKKTYSITCYGNNNETAVDSIEVKVDNPSVEPPTVTITPNPSQINKNESSVLTWNSTNADSCYASGKWFGSRPKSGLETVHPQNTATYNITCVNNFGSAAASAVVTVISSSPTLDLNANPRTINQGDSAVLTWNSTNADSCAASGGWSGAKSVSGNEVVRPTNTTTYYMTCTGQGSSVSDQDTITVGQSLPTVNLTINPGTINQGQSATLSWNSQNANACYASGGWSGSRSTYGSEVVHPNSYTNYYITCSNNYGSASDNESVSINAPQENQTVQISKSSRNIALNQTAFHNYIEAQGLDLVEFEIRIKNTNNQSKTITVKDTLPNIFYYVQGSTKINDASASDGIINSGIYLGYFNAYEEKIVKFQAVVYSGAQQQTITNQATAYLDGISANATAVIQIKNRGKVLGAADVETGPTTPLHFTIFLSLMIAALAYLMMFKYRYWPNLSFESACDSALFKIKTSVIKLKEENQ